MIHTSQTENRLAAIGLSLPPPEGPAYDYDPFKRSGDTVYLAGTLAKETGAAKQLGAATASRTEIANDACTAISFN